MWRLLRVDETVAAIGIYGPLPGQHIINVNMAWNRKGPKMNSLPTLVLISLFLSFIVVVGMSIVVGILWVAWLVIKKIIDRWIKKDHE